MITLPPLLSLSAAAAARAPRSRDLLRLRPAAPSLANQRGAVRSREPLSTNHSSPGPAALVAHHLAVRARLGKHSRVLLLLVMVLVMVLVVTLVTMGLVMMMTHSNAQTVEAGVYRVSASHLQQTQWLRTKPNCHDTRHVLRDV